MRKSTKFAIDVLEKSSFSNLLDVGCGKCKMTSIIARECPNISITASDSLDMSLYVPMGVDFKKVSVYDLSKVFGAEKFEVVMSQHVFEHLHDVYSAFQEFVVCTKKRGYIILETPNWTRLFIPFHNDFFWNDYSHVRIFTKKSFANLAKEFGLEVVLVQSLSSITLKDSFRALVTSGLHPVIFLKRLVGVCINPLLKDSVMLVARKHE